LRALQQLLIYLIYHYLLIYGVRSLQRLTTCCRKV
jgi:hypothetical protein